ncbi:MULTISPECIES: ANTAR domain-containing protein [Arthrobacter]|uniref:ANTAR domain-containing protein n=1 Tax=Arthrobacter sunyaminii TaxID=2816859 RepID=A0A975S783_9MICC|nr:MULTISPECIES: ANTAR domain-containing protein [Arthrobacter]MBO0908065.1 ANTAR domain-containing protein [Arthrobacter sunyaminii]QWQ37091.1 ANTAR domain-containing protein [Arthrobacter sunyaminii]
MPEPATTELSPVRLQELLLEHPALDGFLTALACDLAGHLAEWDVSDAAITVVRPRRQTVHAGSGPGVSAHGQSAADPASGVLTIGLPVPLAGAGGAVLTVYSEHPGAFGPEAVQAVERAAAETATAVALALRLDAQTHRAENLQAALESRTVVDLAAGIIMAQNNCSQQSAVDILRSVSNSRNVKVRDIAAGVVAVVSDRVSTHFEE